MKSHISLFVAAHSNCQITTPSFGTFRRTHILRGEVTGRRHWNQTRSFPNREIICRHFAYSREKWNFVSAFENPPPTLDSPRLSINVSYYAHSNTLGCEIRGTRGADKELHDLPLRDAHRSNFSGRRGGVENKNGRGGVAAGLQPPPPKPTKLKFKKHGFCRCYDIKCYTRFPLRPKSATEVGWWLVH
jgi:hypothetical protein